MEKYNADDISYIRRNKKNSRGIFAIITATFAIIIKLVKYFGFVLKFGKTSISMIITIASYAYIYGLVFAIGFTLLLFVHEMGHFILARKLKIESSLPVFIPFVGAFIALKEEPKSIVHDAIIASGGPILGVISSIICHAIGKYFVSDLFIALAYSGYFINLYNLLPIYPIDGGRILFAVSRKIWFIALPLMIGVLVYSFNPILLIIGFIGSYQMYKYIRYKEERYYSVSNRQKLIFSLIYLGLLIMTAIGLKYTFK